MKRTFIVALSTLLCASLSAQTTEKKDGQETELNQYGQKVSTDRKSVV